MEERFYLHEEASNMLQRFLQTNLLATGTPCIALNNSSGKVEGVWSLWLRHLPYVKFVQSTGLEPALIDEMLALGGQRYNPAVFEKYWQEIADVIQKN